MEIYFRMGHAFRARLLIQCAFLFLIASWSLPSAAQQNNAPTSPGLSARQVSEFIAGMVSRAGTLNANAPSSIDPNVKQQINDVVKGLSALQLRVNNAPLDSIRRAVTAFGQQLNKLEYQVLAPEPSVQPDLVNEVFMTYKLAKGKNPGSRYFADRADLKKFYDEFSMKQLRTYLDKGRFNVYVPCETIMNVGVCIPAGRYNEMEISSALKTVLKDGGPEFLNSLRRAISKVVAAADGKTTGTIFLDLNSLLLEAYMETAPDFPDCCPDDPNFNAKDATRMKICHALQLPGGLSVNLLDANSRKSFSLLGFNGKLDSREGLDDGLKIQVEPRQYVTIYEREKRSSNAIPIWWLVKANDTIEKDETEAGLFNMSRTFAEKFYTRQVREAVDKNSIIEIRFDQEAIARNVDFYGNISLAASIGDRKIEVAPYSVIGEERRSLGVNAEPIRKIANNFMRLFIESQRADAEFRKLKEAPGFKKRPAPEDVKRQLDEKIKYLITYYSRVKTTYGYGDSVKIYRYLPRHIRNNLQDILYYVTSPQLFDFYYNPDKYDFGTLLSALSNAESTVNAPGFVTRINPNEERFASDISAKYEAYVLTVKRIKEFMDFYSSSGEDSKRAFLNLTSISEIDFNQIKALVTTDPELTPDSWADFAALTNQDPARHKLDQIHGAIKRLNMFSGELRKILKDNRYYATFLRIDTDMPASGLNDVASDSIEEASSQQALAEKERAKDRLAPENVDRLLEDENVSLLYDYPAYRKIRDELARLAGKELFSKLVYATIDLAAADVPEGSELKISVMWYNTNGLNSETSAEGIELVTAKILVKKTGWYREFAESALFIDRINENLANPATVTPARFQVAAGVSMLWTYHNDFQGENFFARTWRWLEPSFGINVSFLNFYEGDAFEFGAGPIIGLWENRVFLVSGYNFNVNGDSPFYMGVGFSFMNLFRTKEEKKEDND